MDLRGTYGKGETYYLTLQDVDSNILTSHTFQAGDAKIGEDGGVLVNLNTLPTIVNGQLVLVTSDIEAEAKQLVIQFHDQAGDEWLDSTFRINTKLNGKIPIVDATDLGEMTRHNSYILVDDIVITGGFTAYFDVLDMQQYQLTYATAGTPTYNVYLIGNKLIQTKESTGKIPDSIIANTSTGAIFNIYFKGLDGRFLKLDGCTTGGENNYIFHGCTTHNLVVDIDTGDGLIRSADSFHYGVSNNGSMNAVTEIKTYKAVGGVGSSVLYELFTINDANMTQIDGLATDGNNATLKLKQLDIQNSAGSALVAKSTGSNGHGFDIAGNGSGEGITSKGGLTGHGAYIEGGNTSGHGLVVSAVTGGTGLIAISGGGDGISASGTGKDISASEIDALQASIELDGFLSVTTPAEFKAMVEGKKYRLANDIGLGSEVASIDVSFDTLDLNSFEIESLPGSYTLTLKCDRITSSGTVGELKSMDNISVNANRIVNTQFFMIDGLTISRALCENCLFASVTNFYSSPSDADQVYFLNCRFVSTTQPVGGKNLNFNFGTSIMLNPAQHEPSGGYGDIITDIDTNTDNIITAVGQTNGKVDDVQTTVDAIEVDTDITIPALIAALNDPSSAVIADAVWDEILTGTTHNIPTSAGRRLREAAGVVVWNGKAQGSGVGTNQIQLDVGASSVDGTYDPALIAIVDGTGAGQSRVIFEYNGATRTATVDRDWKVLPDITSDFIIYANPGRNHVNEGLAQGGTLNTIILNSLASLVDNIYNGQLVFIRSGTGADQIGTIISYDGGTQTATIVTGATGGNWPVTPNTTSGYILLPEHVYSLAEIKAQATSALIDYDGPTRAEATSDKNEIIVEVDANETKIDAVKVDTAAINSNVGIAGAGLTAVPGLILDTDFMPSGDSETVQEFFQNLNWAQARPRKGIEISSVWYEMIFKQGSDPDTAPVGDRVMRRKITTQAGLKPVVESTSLNSVGVIISS